jgi:BioD-like phosphotransacetylase family protein
MAEPKRLFVAATRQNEGKTTTCLGIILNLKKQVTSLGFIKPVGQRYIEVAGERIDKDAVLIDEVFHLHPVLKDQSPIAISKGFTREYDRVRHRSDLMRDVLRAYEAVAKDREMVIIEGTGHAGVGSCFDLNNADVAKLLDAPVLIVTGGGMGRPVDEIMLNLPVFERQGVRVLGALCNKVLPEKLDEVREYVAKALSARGVRLFGVMPLEQRLSGSTLQQVRDEVDAEVLNGADMLEAHIGDVLVGATEPHRALEHFGPRTLLITSGGREDLILAALSACTLDASPGACVAGIILTDGIYPHKAMMRLIGNTNMPILLVKSDIYETTSRIHDLIVKIRPADAKKIEIAGSLVERYIDLPAILGALDHGNGST